MSTAPATETPTEPWFVLAADDVAAALHSDPAAG